MDETTRNYNGKRLKEAAQKSRGYADFFEWPDKGIKERGVVQSLFETIEKWDEKFFSELSTRGEGNDPPDCEAKDANDNRIGIEVTELVDSASIKNYINTKYVNWATWDSSKLVEAINERISTKDTPEKVKGGPYHGYFLVIHTDEPELSYSRVNDMLNNITFPPPLMITRAFLLISYDPNLRLYPYLELEWSS